MAWRPFSEQEELEINTALIEAENGLVGYSLDAYGAYSEHDDDGYDDFIRKIPMDERDEQIIFEDKLEEIPG